MITWFQIGRIARGIYSLDTLRRVLIPSNRWDYNDFWHGWHSAD